MQKRFITLLFLLIFTGCGSTSTTDQTSTTQQADSKLAVETKPSQTVAQTGNIDSNSKKPVTIIPTQQQVEDTLSEIKHDAEDIIPIEESDTEKVVTQTQTPQLSERSVTLYIHGYDDEGVTYDNTYGYDAYDPILDRLVALTGFDTLKTYDRNNFTNVITITPYYGSKPPAYYTPEDIAEVEEVTKKYGGGIPRYALIIAKYARHVMKLTGAEHLNIVSASMGSLVARWMIEKDLEQLASQKRIRRWQTLEGVIRGNRMASQKELVDIADEIQKQPIDVKHMSYKWIEKYLHNPRGESDSPYYEDIVISQVTSTKQGKPFGWLMPDVPNDGYQAAVDTYFSSLAHVTTAPTHTYFHQTHLGLKKDDGAWANVATFLLPHKRVTITLTSAEIYDLHESGNPFNKKAEIVFESRVYSPLLVDRWQIEDAISEQLYDSGILPVHRYKKKDEIKTFRQVIYDDYVLKDETTLQIRMAAYEVDQSLLYHIHDGFGKRDKLGETTLTIDLKTGDYTIVGEDWSGTLHIEVE